MGKCSLLTKLAKCTLNIALKLTFSVFLFFFVFWLHFWLRQFFTQMTVENCRSKKGLKQCLGGLKCSQNTKKNKKTLKVSFKAIFNVHFG